METHETHRRVWITGAAGLIGRCLAETRTPESAGFHIVPLARPDLDLTDFAAVERRFRAEKPTVVMHCAAMAKTGDCQARPAAARKINIDATAHLAALAEDAAFIFFSTDLVFDGRKGHYIESDHVNPLSIYAETKAAAEQLVLKNPKHTIVRTSLNSGTTANGSAYNEQLLSAWKKGQTLHLFLDEFRCPIPASVTARAVWELVGKSPGGLWHLAGAERLSRVDIGNLAAARHPELVARIQPGSLRDYHGPPRVPDASLNCAAMQKLLSFPLPGLTEYLRHHPEEPF